MRVSHNNAIEFISVKKKRSTLQPSREASRNETEVLGVFKTILIEPEEEKMFDLTIFYEATRNELWKILEDTVQERQAFKCYLRVKVVLEKSFGEGEL